MTVRITREPGRVVAKCPECQKEGSVEMDDFHPATIGEVIAAVVGRASARALRRLRWQGCEHLTSPEG